jgi:hypothetical protein
MLDTLSSTSLLALMEIGGPIVLAAAIIYASMQWSRRRRTRAQVTEAATRGLYREADRQEAREQLNPLAPSAAAVHDEIPPNPKIRGKLRSGREEARRSEDDLARDHLGVTGRGDPTKPKVLDERETQINKHLDPGHTA